MPKSSSNHIEIVPKKNAVINAPKQSIRKRLLGFEVSLISINRTFIGIDVSYHYFALPIIVFEYGLIQNTLENQGDAHEKNASNTLKLNTNIY